MNKKCVLSVLSTSGWSEVGEIVLEDVSFRLDICPRCNEAEADRMIGGNVGEEDHFYCCRRCGYRWALRRLTATTGEVVWFTADGH